jgi:hypothetical protein
MILRCQKTPQALSVKHDHHYINGAKNNSIKDLKFS